jgi:hypothetical protein
VRAVQHVFRRGAVYWWRRRIVQKVGESDRAPIAISLNTSELFLARTIAAHLTLESERILREEKWKMMSAQQVRTMLVTVARDHLHKLNRIAALELADGISAADGRRSDLVMGWALRLKAARGDRATVATSDHAAILDSGLAPSDIEEIDQTISALRQSHFGHKPPGKILRLLDECGAPQSPGDIAQAQSIVHRGQAAALMAVDERWSGRYTEDDRLIDGIVNDGSRTAVSASAVAAVEGPNQSTLREAVAPSTPLMVPSPDATPPAASEPVVSPAIASIVVLTERLIEEKAVLEEWRQKTQDQVRSVSALFVKMLGTDDVARISQSAVADYRSLLLRLPKTYGKNPSDFGRSLEDILKEAKKLPKEKVGRKGTTLNRHLTQLKAVIEYIETSGNSIGDYRSVEKLRAKTETRARDARAVFTADNIRGFFQTAPWTGCAGETDRLKQGPVIIHDALYWVPILAKSTLGRREEICGLDVDDVGEFEGIPFVIFDYSKHRLLKNRQSIRRIPLLGEVTRLGFLQYRDAIKALGHRLLFPELRAQSDKTPLGDVFHGDWIKVQDLVVPNAAEEKKSFHSFRKTSGSDLKDAGIASELRADILGHGGKNITEERYASSAKLAQMLEALQRMPNYTADLVPRVVNLREDVIASRARASAKSRRLMRPQIGGS